jgi:hypothetical protein
MYLKRSGTEKALFALSRYSFMPILFIFLADFVSFKILKIKPLTSMTNVSIKKANYPTVLFQLHLSINDAPQINVSFSVMQGCWQ